MSGGGATEFGGADARHWLQLLAHSAWWYRTMARFVQPRSTTHSLPLSATHLLLPLAAHPTRYPTSCPTQISLMAHPLAASLLSGSIAFAHPPTHYSLPHPPIRLQCVVNINNRTANSCAARLSFFIRAPHCKSNGQRAANKSGVGQPGRNWDAGWWQARSGRSVCQY